MEGHLQKPLQNETIIVSPFLCLPSAGGDKWARKKWREKYNSEVIIFITSRNTHIHANPKDLIHSKHKYNLILLTLNMNKMIYLTFQKIKQKWPIWIPGEKMVVTVSSKYLVLNFLIFNPYPSTTLLMNSTTLFFIHLKGTEGPIHVKL